MSTKQSAGVLGCAGWVGEVKGSTELPLSYRWNADVRLDMTQCYETEEMSEKKVFVMMLGTRPTRQEKKKRGSGWVHKLECSCALRGGIAYDGIR